MQKTAGPKNSPSTLFRILTALKRVKTRFQADFLTLKHLFDLILHVLKVLKSVYELKSVSFANKFSFYCISHINVVKRCKNWFLSQLLEFIGSVWSDTLYYESIELSLEAEDCVSHVCMFFPFFLFFIFCWCWLFRLFSFPFFFFCFSSVFLFFFSFFCYPFSFLLSFFFSSFSSFFFLFSFSLNPAVH